MFVPDNSAQSAKKYVEEHLSSIYGDREARNMAYWLLEHHFQWTKTAILTQELRLTESELLTLRRSLKRLEKREPLQYVLGSCPFGPLNLKVDARVLIPRPETEEWLHFALKLLGKEGRAIDLGTGSGCIPLLFKQQKPKWEISAIDVSEGAVELAKENAALHALKVAFWEDDIFKPSHRLTDQGWDVILSNPPYIGEEEAEEMEEHVTKYEPHLALFSPGDPLKFYKKIIAFGAENLKPKGWVFLELHERYAEKVKALSLEYAFEDVKIFSDLQGKARMLYFRSSASTANSSTSP